MSRKTGIFYLTIVLAVIVLALLMRDFVAEKIIVPLLEFIRVFDDLPQALLWFFVIGVIMLFEWKSLARWAFPDSRQRRSKIDQRGRIEVLADLIRRARREAYFRKKLSQYLADLTFAILAYRKGSTPKRMKKCLESGTLDIPPEMSAYFQAGYERSAAPHRDQADASMNLNPADVVAFLERQLLERQLEVDDGE
jgi:hypothetical protein